MSGRARTALSRTRLRLPIRLKLAVVSAGLTFVILLLFAIVVGALTEQRLRVELQQRPARHRRGPPGAAADPAQPGGRARVRRRPEPRCGPPPPAAPAIRVVDSAGRRPRPRRPPADLGPPVEGGVRDVGRLPGGGATAVRGLARPQRQLRPRPSPDRRRRGVRPVRQAARAACRAPSTACTSSSRWGSSAAPGWPSWPGSPWRGARCARSPGSRGPRARWPAPATPPIACPSPEANDEVAELAATLEDMLRELDAARSETEAALERQREFVADASHELRTPLTSILANLELLEEELDRERRAARPRGRRRDRRLRAALVAADAAPGGRPAAAGARGRRRPRPARRSRRAGRRPSTWAPWRATPRARPRRCARGTT